MYIKVFRWDNLAWNEIGKFSNDTTQNLAISLSGNTVSLSYDGNTVAFGDVSIISLWQSLENYLLTLIRYVFLYSMKLELCQFTTIISCLLVNGH